MSAKHDSPSAASTIPACSGLPARSCSSAKPNSAVKKTWVCNSTEARAAVMPTLSAMNKIPNWPTP